MQRNYDKNPFSIQATRGYDSTALQEKVDAGPDKRNFQDSYEYGKARVRYGSLSPEDKERVAANELSAGCLIKQLRREQLNSASPTACDNVDCQAYRPDFHTDQVALGSTCLTDARPTDTFYK